MTNILDPEMKKVTISFNGLVSGDRTELLQKYLQGFMLNEIVIGQLNNFIILKGKVNIEIGEAK